MVYVPLTYRTNESGTFVIRTQNDPAAMADPIRKAIWSVDAQVVVPEVRTMETVVDGSLAARNFQLHLLLAFAACALVLAALGIYGVVAYSALQRTRELGIRIALGAQPAQIYRLILEDGVTPVLVGTLAGIALAGIGRPCHQRVALRRRWIQHRHRRRRSRHPAPHRRRCQPAARHPRHPHRSRAGPPRRISTRIPAPVCNESHLLHSESLGSPLNQQ